MCGIVGILNRDPSKPVDRRLLSRMNSLILHRGPDEVGEFVAGPVAFGHRRLAIIDLASGHQPMRDVARDRTIVYNGEIYNFKEIRETLPGIRFQTHSDTEVLLKLAEFDSFEWLERLNGMFAFAVWDNRASRMLIARDRLGIKPLYYVNLGDELLFSSEIKPLLLHPRVERRVNVDKIPEFMAFRTVTGTGTLFEGIHELAPGHAMSINLDDFEPKIVRWWQEGAGRSVTDYADSTATYEDQFQSLMTDAVRYRLISDVPVGSFNSGGVDSSLNSAIMRSLTEGEMHTFSVGFEEVDYDERKYAQIVADKLGTHHHALVIGEQEYVQHLPEALLHLEEPINHAHTIQLLLLCRYAKQFVTVVLTGEGADELFGGYPRLQIPLLSSYLQHLPRFVSAGLLHVSRAARQRKLTKLLETSYDVKRSVIENARYVPAADFDLLYPLDVIFKDRESAYRSSIEKYEGVIRQALYFDQQTYLPSLLNRLDKVSMASALECRVPFIDPSLLEWSYLLPDRFKLRAARANKYIVKKVAEDWLPKEIVYRDKVGFGTPVGQWFRNPGGLGGYLDLLADQTFRERGFFDPSPVRQIVAEHLSGAADHDEALWSLMNLELWCQTFIDDNSFFREFEGSVAQASAPMEVSSA